MRSSANPLKQTALAAAMATAVFPLTGHAQPGSQPQVKGYPPFTSVPYVESQQDQDETKAPYVIYPHHVVVVFPAPAGDNLPPFTPADLEEERSAIVWLISDASTDRTPEQFDRAIGLNSKTPLLRPPVNGSSTSRYQTRKFQSYAYTISYNLTPNLPDDKNTKYEVTFSISAPDGGRTLPSNECIPMAEVKAMAEKAGWHTLTPLWFMSGHGFSAEKAHQYLTVGSPSAPGIEDIPNQSPNAAQNQLVWQGCAAWILSASEPWS